MHLQIVNPDKSFEWMGHDIRAITDGYATTFVSQFLWDDDQRDGFIFCPRDKDWNHPNYRAAAVDLFIRARRLDIPCYGLYIDRSGEPGIYELDEDMAYKKGTRNKLFESNPTFIQTSLRYDVE